MLLSEAKKALMDRRKVKFVGKTLNNLQHKSTEYECLEALIFKNRNGKVVVYALLKDIKANAVLECNLEDVEGVYE